MSFSHTFSTSTHFAYFGLLEMIRQKKPDSNFKRVITKNRNKEKKKEFYGFQKQSIKHHFVAKSLQFI